jgi:DNA-binding winged helix-turn-helix (wHTH) protein/tetratricopeptide (TPR) repeat protein
MVHVFEGCRLDEGQRELRRVGKPVHVQPKVFDLLVFLIRHRDRVVTREELLEALWPDEHVGEPALNGCIKAARQAVGDGGTRQEVIRTYHGRGYRFVAPVEQWAGGPEVDAPAPPVDAPRGAPEGVFVGRDRELERLHAACAATLAGKGRIVLLVGEPGIGKTRLAEQLAAYARGRGARVLVGRCYEGELAPAFWPWVQIVRAYMADHDGVALRAAMGAAGADIAALVPELRERVPDLPLVPHHEHEHARVRLFDALAAFFTRAARRTPLTLVLDDLHWADRSSLRFLQFLAAEIADVPLLLLGAYRDADVDAEPARALLDVVAALSRERHYERLLLHRLSEDAIRELVQAVAGTEVPGAVTRTVIAQSEGNPFFAHEILRHLTEEGALAPTRAAAAGPAVEEVGVPEGAHSVIQRRLGRLSERCRRVLALAAAVGREFSSEVLARITEERREELLLALEEAWAARVIREAPGAVDHYSFAHSLIRESLYRELSPMRRIALHERIGRALEALYAGNPGPHLDELAYHFVRAAPGGVVQEAVDYAARAGQWALTHLAYDEAVRHFDRALDLLDGRAAADARRRCEVLLALGDAQWRAGAPDASRATFERAAAGARGLHAADLLARAALGVMPRVNIPLVEPVEPPLGLLEEALAALGETDDALRAMVLARLASALYYAATPGAHERAVALSEQAAELARRTGNPATLAWALYNRHYALWRPGTLEERLACARELIELADRLGHSDMKMEGFRLRIADLVEAGDVEAADLQITEYTRLAEELRQPSFQWFALNWRAMRALLAGQFAEAKALTEAALARGPRVGERTAMTVYFGININAAIMLGTLGEWADTIEALAGQPHPIYRTARALLRLEQKKPARAREDLDRLGARDFDDLPPDNLWFGLAANLAIVCSDLRDARRAAALYERLRPYRTCCIAVGSGVVCGGAVARYLGLLASVTRRWGEAAEHFEQALAFNERIGACAWTAHTRCDYGLMLLERNARGDRRKAEKLLDQARDAARNLGMPGLLRKLESTLP